MEAHIVLAILFLSLIVGTQCPAQEKSLPDADNVILAGMVPVFRRLVLSRSETIKAL